MASLADIPIVSIKERILISCPFSIPFVETFRQPLEAGELLHHNILFFTINNSSHVY